jgi:hypothetical protein
MVNSLITQPVEGARLPAGKAVNVTGIAWDSGAGVRRVEVSLDGGSTWSRAELGDDLGRFSFRPWRFSFTPMTAVKQLILARASNAQGTTQPSELIFNTPGYHNNVVQKVAVDIA